jgi:SAM-dependent methyltransferase
VDPDEYRQASYEVWERMAAGWHREHDFLWEASRRVGEWMVDALEPRPGQTILELAAGIGETGFAAAAAVGESGRLISTDFSPAMVEAARRRGEELGLHNVEYRVLDAERMDLEDDSVDGVLCRWGYMLMADPGSALAETRRVLRDGGRVSLSVWAPPERNPWAAVPGGVLVDREHMPRPEPEAPGIFALAEEERLRELLSDAALEPLRVEEVEMAWTFPDPDAYWRFLTDLAGALAMVIAELPPEERRTVRGEIEARIEPHSSNGGYEMPALCLNAVAA